jgi:hypothetical protein
MHQNAVQVLLRVLEAYSFILAQILCGSGVFAANFFKGSLVWFSRWYVCDGRLAHRLPVVSATVLPSGNLHGFMAVLSIFIHSLNFHVLRGLPCIDDARGSIGLN